jgi:GntR family transcriptional regulator/MocR family aminotransferase
MSIGMVQLAHLIVSLERRAPVPLYLQLRNQITQLVSAGKLPPGSRLPASRDLAEQLGVNRATVSSAYDQLVADGLARSHVGQGTFITGAPEPSPSADMTWPFSQAMEAVGRQRRHTTPRTEHPSPIDFASLVPDEELFPIEPFRDVLNEVLDREGKQLLQYGPVPGYEPLREYIATQLAERGVRASPDDVQIVNGSQQGLDLVFRTLVDPGDRVAVESPTYSVVLPVLAQYRAQLLNVPMTHQGMDLNALEAALARQTVKLVYSMPTFHNPTGITMDLESRKRILQLAARYRMPIIEDDFESELRFAGHELPPLKALDEFALVIYLGTFSKGLFPGLRLGWIVAPGAVVETLSRTKMFSDYHSSPLLQAAVLEFCRRGHYQEHLRRLTRIYRKKSRRLVDAMTRFFPDEVTWTEPDGGYAYWITMPEGVSSQALLSESARAGVLFTPGTHFFTGDGGDRFFRISISRVPADRIDEGVRCLGEIIKRLLTATGHTRRRHSDRESVFHI